MLTTTALEEARGARLAKVLGEDRVLEQLRRLFRVVGGDLIAQMTLGMRRTTRTRAKTTTRPRRTRGRHGNTKWGDGKDWICLLAPATSAGGEDVAAMGGGGVVPEANDGLQCACSHWECASLGTRNLSAQVSICVGDEICRLFGHRGVVLDLRRRGARDSQDRQ